MAEIPTYRHSSEDFAQLPEAVRRSVGAISASLAQQTEGFVRELKKKTNAGSLDVLRLAVMLAENGVSQLLGPRKLACTKGCSYCCYLRVEVFDHEIYGIVAYLIHTWTPAEVKSLYHKLEATANQSQNLTSSEHLAKKLPCTFLSEEGTCRIYPVRPIVCVAYHSLNKAECVTAHDNPEEPWVTQVAEILIGVHGVSLGVMNVVDPKKRQWQNPPKDMHELILPVLRNRIKARYGEAYINPKEIRNEAQNLPQL